MKNEFMERALELAMKGYGFTSPNPCVGAVIEKGGHIVGEGYHRRAGADHAEVVAIKEVMKKSGIVSVDLEPKLFENATLYCTLEPCSHQGATPPCSLAVVAAGFKKVVIGMKDPSSKVNGRGINYLKKHGVDVEVVDVSSSLAGRIRFVNRFFTKFVKTGFPYVVMKAGISLDGKIATATGDSKWITSEAMRDDARVLRSEVDAVVVGVNTVINDDPELAAHGKFRNKKLLKVVIDPKLRSSLGAKIFRDENVFVACTSAASVKDKKRFEKAGIAYKSFGKDRVSIKQLLSYLAKRNVLSVFVEGGGGVHGHFYDAFLKDSALLDEVVLYVAPKLIGGRDSVSVIGGIGISSIKKAPVLKGVEYKVVGDELRVRGYF